jgi:hypothetical protein
MFSSMTISTIAYHARASLEHRTTIVSNGTRSRLALTDYHTGIGQVFDFQPVEYDHNASPLVPVFCNESHNRSKMAVLFCRLDRVERDIAA